MSFQLRPQDSRQTQYPHSQDANFIALDRDKDCYKIQGPMGTQTDPSGLFVMSASGTPSLPVYLTSQISVSNFETGLATSANQTSGDQKTQLVDSTKASYTVQNPLTCDGDSVYAKDIDVANSTKVGWTGNIIDLFDCPFDTVGMYNDTSTTPKILYISFCRTLYLNAIGLGCALAGKTFSNVKIEFIGSDGTVRSTFDDSTNSTKYGTNLYQFTPTACVAVRFYFVTTNTDIGLTNITIQKELSTISTIKGIDEDTGVAAYIKTSGGDFNVLARLRNATGNTKINPATSDNQTTELARVGKIYDTITTNYLGLQFHNGYPQICSQDYLYAMAEGDITGHTLFNKFGRVVGVGNSLVDVWAGEGGNPSVYVFPPSAIQFHVVSTSANDDNGNTGVNKLMIVGLDSNYAEQTEEVTLDGTSVVTTTKSFIRINFCYATLVGTAGFAVGTITIKNTADTVTYAVMSIGLTACRQLIYTVPASKILYLTSLVCGSGAGGNSIKLNAVTFTPKYRLFGSTVFIPSGEVLSINSETVRMLEAPAAFPEKTDIKMSVQGDYASGGTTCVSAVRGWIE